MGKTILIALDGTQYFCSKEICCPQCSTKRHSDETITYSHSVVTPVIVAPNKDKVLPLEPEFVTPQDGTEKQDCENTAAKRWIRQWAERCRKFNSTILGDDLYCCQPLCQLLLDEQLNFIFVCKPTSHTILFQLIDELDQDNGVETLVVKRKKGKSFEFDTYRFVNQVPIRAGADALDVNWCEITTTKKDGRVVYKNSFVTNHLISKHNVTTIVACGRSRWKIENENNNTLKTKGYNLEHNFGHGKKHLASFLATLNILALLLHTTLAICDEKYQLIRNKIRTRKNFFDDIRALTRYWYFDSWEHLLLFMMQGLEIERPP